MKKYLSFWVLSLMTLQSFAQINYGNDWYRANANRDFIKLIVDEDGLYRVSQQDLSTAGFDLSNVPAANLQLYYRGKEVPIYVSPSGNSFNFIEFYGFANDGEIDSIMYRDFDSGVHTANQQPDQRFSLFTDKSAYFLTWSNNPIGNRVFNAFDPTYQLYTKEPFVYYEAIKSYQPNTPETEYSFGGGGPYEPFLSLNSDYILGEGYIGPGFSVDDPTGPLVVNIPTPKHANTGRPATIKTRVFGRSKSPHILEVELNNEGIIIDSTIARTAVYLHTYEEVHNLQNSLPATSSLTFTAKRPGTDNNHVCWSSILYDRLPDMDGDSSMVISNWSNNSKTLLELDNTTGNDTIFVYDLVNNIRHIGLIQNGTARTIIFPFNNERKLYVSTDRAIKKPMIEGASLNKVFERQGAEFVIITHRDLAQSAEAYRNYRDTATIHDLNATVVYTDEIYDEFSYGSMTPWAIKRFCKFAIDNWQVTPKYFLLWGKGRYETRKFENSAIVPTYGYPATDYEFVSHFNQNSIEINPEASIGRVNVLNDSEGQAFLDKVNEYEHLGWEGWMKNGVFLGGGNTPGEQNEISLSFSGNITTFSDLPFGGKEFYFQKRSNDVVIDPATASYHDQISSGVGLIHFFGHSTSNILDISIRRPNEYNNFSRYPFMIAMGCYGGDFAGSDVSKSFGESWVTQANRGAIGYLANSSAGYLNPLKRFGTVLYQYMYKEMAGEPIGDIIRQAVFTYTDSLNGIQYRNHGKQLNLQGDPALTLFYPNRPDLEVNETSRFLHTRGLYGTGGFI